MGSRTRWDLGRAERIEGYYSSDQRKFDDRVADLANSIVRNVYPPCAIFATYSGILKRDASRRTSFTLSKPHLVSVKLGTRVVVCKVHK